MRRKLTNTKRRKGGMKNVARPLGKAVVSLGESYGKDYLQNKSMRVAEGVYNDPSLLKNPGFMLTGNQPVKPPSIPYKVDMSYDKENQYPNVGKLNVGKSYDKENQPYVHYNKPSFQLDLGGSRHRRQRQLRKSRKTKKYLK